MRKRAASVAAALVIALVGAGQGHAETSAQVRSLAQQAAAGDAAALGQLKGIEEVDGRPFRVGAALAGASGSDLTERLRTLAGTEQPAAGVNGDPAGDAASILSERRFQEDRTGIRPFRGVLSWLGDVLHRLVARPYSWLAGVIPGGERTLDVVLAGLVLGAVAFAAWLLSSRRGGVLVDRSVRHRHSSDGDPAALELQADEAERRGDLELALRLRFRAGLVRLQRSGSIPAGQRTSRELRRALQLAEFDRLSRMFDEIVYGRRAPSRSDIEATRSDWRVILDRAGAA